MEYDFCYIEGSYILIMDLTYILSLISSFKQENDMIWIRYLRLVEYEET